MLGLQSSSGSKRRTQFRPFSENWFRRLLILYLVLIVTHFAEHVLQLIQAAVLAWPRPEAGGLLGLWSPQLLTNESLHFSYNLMQLLGLLVLSYHVAGRARPWWRIAIAVQLWHFFEHFLLQSQWLTGIFLFNAVKQTGIGELLLPRLELHFIYNSYPIRRIYADAEIVFDADDQYWEFADTDGTVCRVANPREFNHKLSTVVNGLNQREFQILGIWENDMGDADAPPGSWEHLKAVAPHGLRLWAAYGG